MSSKAEAIEATPKSSVGDEGAHDHDPEVQKEAADDAARFTHWA